MATTAADYIDRSYDIMAFQGVLPVGKAKLEQSLFGGGSGTICTGIQKLAQRFLIELLTELGSVPYDLTRGTEFITTIRRGGIRTDTDIFVAFGFAAALILQQLRNLELPDDPADEKISNVDLDNIVFTPGFASLTIKIISQAGTTRKAILPIPLVV